MSAPASRNHAIDYMKGALVLIMVLYHWLNYFTSWDADVYRYLRFLTPSFIFVTGFLISHVYLARPAESYGKVARRLIARGCKLFAVFLVLNLGTSWIKGSAGLDFFPDPVAQLLWGNVVSATSKAVSFFILMPISYLLILSAPLVLVSRRFPYAIQVACGLFLAATLALEARGRSSANLELLSLGLLGAAVGRVPLPRIEGVVGHPAALGLAYAVYLAAIAVWDAQYVLQIVGVCLSMAVLYLVASAQANESRVSSQVILLGQYSLVAYIAQIAVLRVLQRLLGAWEPVSLGLALSLVGGCLLTLAAVVLLDQARKKMRSLDRLYGAIFA